MDRYLLKIKEGDLDTLLSITLPASKSESNRALIIQALAPEGSVELENLSDANDTQVLARALKQLNKGNTDINVEDAGTAMRFLAAYMAMKAPAGATLTGTERMNARPMQPLLDHLIQLGAKIEYLKEEGRPPLRFGGFEWSGIKHLKLGKLPSSQMLSALAMIGPSLPEGLVLEFNRADVPSLPYAEATFVMMEALGASIVVENEEDPCLAYIMPEYKGGEWQVESDWSAAGFWYVFSALSGRTIHLNDLFEDSIQGDSVLFELMDHFGLQSMFTEEGLTITPNPDKIPGHINLNFAAIPDLAQPLLVLCAALDVHVQAKGLETLRVKETDRIEALARELHKFGVHFHEHAPGVYDMHGHIPKDWNKPIRISTYHDHRMAMAFAPLALRGPLEIENPGVARKSYPGFWQEAAKLLSVKEL